MRGAQVCTAAILGGAQRVIQIEPVESTVSVAIVEEEPLARDLLRNVLPRRCRRIEVVGAFPDPATALDLLPEVKPQVVLSDVEPAGALKAMEFAARLREDLPKTGVVFLARQADIADLFSSSEALAGGWSWVIKESTNAMVLLEQAICSAAAGFVVLDPAGVSPPRRRRSSPLDRLTLRQRQVLTLLAQGLTNAAIAERLGISEKSVKNYVNVLYQELGIDREDGAQQPRVQAALIYVRESQR